MRSALLLVFAVFFSHAAFTAAPTPTRIAITAAHLVAPEQGKVSDHPLVLIEGDRITEVRSGDAVPDGYTHIDLGNATLLPGLIDSHTHLVSDPASATGNYWQDTLQTSAIDMAVAASIRAQRTLEAGFTSVRDVGSYAYIAMPALKARNGDTSSLRTRVNGCF